MTVAELCIVIGLTANVAAVLYGNRRADKKINAVHDLVNSNLTAVMRSEFDAVTRELALMLEVVSLKEAAGGYVASVETLATIKAAQARIVELGIALSYRER